MSSAIALPKQSPRPGTIDTSFGVDGYLSVEEPGNPGHYLYLNACAYDNDRDLIYVVAAITDLDWVVCRLRGVSGEIDTSFGEMDGHKGFRRLPYPPDPYGILWKHIAIGEDGSITVLAYAIEMLYTVAPLACRVLHDGTIDTSFGDDGLAFYKLPMPPLNRMATRSMLATPSPAKESRRNVRSIHSSSPVQTSRLADDALLFMACIGNGNISYLLKIDRHGQLDPSFGGQGFVLVGDINQRAFSFQAEATRGGHIVVAGSVSPNTGLVMRYESRGYLDITFGIGGRVEITDPAWSCTCRDVRIAADGKIVALVALFGAGFPLPHQAAGVVRLDRNGRRDDTFNHGEIAVVETPPDLFIGRQLALDEGTRPIIGANRTQIQGGFFNSHIMLARFMGDGKLDHTFGTNGLTDPVTPNGEPSTLLDMAIERPAKILVMGSGEPEFIARLNG
jgi:uncharacterized delta-60 repeat protein